MIGSKEHRAVVAGGLLALAIVFGIVSWRRPQIISDPQPMDGSRAAELITRLDPNVADVKDLSAIPGLGEKRAAAIVAYREMWSRHHPKEPAFRSVEDLTHISGIGAATATNMAPYVVFSSR